MGQADAAGAQAYKQGNYQEAEKLFKAVLAEVERAGERGEPLAVSLNNLGALYSLTGKPNEAAEFLKRSLAIREEQLGPTHPQVATGLNNLADAYRTKVNISWQSRFFGGL